LHRREHRIFSVINGIVLKPLAIPMLIDRRLLNRWTIPADPAQPGRRDEITSALETELVKHSRIPGGEMGRSWRSRRVRRDARSPDFFECLRSAGIGDYSTARMPGSGS